MNNDQFKLDWESMKDLFVKLFPISELLINNKKWDKLYDDYKTRRSKLTIHGTLQSECLLDYVIGAFHPNSNEADHRKLMLESINNEIEKAYINLPQFKSKINELVRNMILSVDVNENSTNSDFKNWINELFALNKLMEFGTYKLTDIAFKLPNGKDIDYKFENIETKEEILIEVITIQKLDPSKQDDSTTMNEFITKRLIEKYDNKVMGLAPNHNYNINILCFIEHIDGLEIFDIGGFQYPFFEPMIVCRSFENGLWKFKAVQLSEYLELIKTQNTNEI